ncbi:predicted protein [Postia placenta Mad-698-R]|nr:predicted protein [Postia placenta Mad-698-R]
MERVVSVRVLITTATEYGIKLSEFAGCGALGSTFGQASTFQNLPATAKKAAACARILSDISVPCQQISSTPASLTCRAWEAAFRPMLFRWFCVNNRNLRRAHSLLLANKQIGTYVRYLTFNDFESWSAHWQQQQHKTLVFILAQFPQVTNLCLKVHVLTPSTLDVLALLSPSVQFLAVGTLMGATPDAFTRLIRAFSNLRTLSIEEDLYIHPEGKGLSSASVMERLMRTLGIAFTPPAQRERDWYHRAIDTVSWNKRDRTIRGDPRALAALLQDAAPSLTCLRLCHRYWYDGDTAFGKKDNPSITSMEFWTYDKYRTPRFLSQVRPAKIRVIKFMDFSTKERVYSKRGVRNQDGVAEHFTYLRLRLCGRLRMSFISSSYYLLMPELGMLSLTRRQCDFITPDLGPSRQFGRICHVRVFCQATTTHYPTLDFHKLEEVLIVACWIAEYDDAILIDMASSWPNLRRLILIPEDADDADFIIRATLRPLQAFAFHCPHLECLKVVFHADGNKIPAVSPNTKRDRLPQNLDYINIGPSTTSGSLSEIAAFMAKIFPALCEIDSDVILSEDWKIINGFLIVHRRVREEGRQEVRDEMPAAAAGTD